MFRDKKNIEKKVFNIFFSSKVVHSLSTIWSFMETIGSSLNGLFILRYIQLVLKSSTNDWDFTMSLNIALEIFNIRVYNVSGRDWCVSSATWLYVAEIL